MMLIAFERDFERISTKDPGNRAASYRQCNKSDARANPKYNFGARFLLN